MINEDLQQIKELLQENNKNLVTKDDLVENNKNLVTKDDLVENNKNLVTKDDLVENNKSLEKIIDEKVDKLAILTKQGFDELENKLDKHDEKVDNLAIMTKQGFDELEKKLKKHIVDQVDPINQEIKEIKYRLNSAEKELIAIKARLDQLIKTEENDIQENTKHVSMLTKLFEKLEQEVIEIKEKIKILTLSQAVKVN